MSDIADAASVRIVLADYIGVDAGGKANIIGAGLEMVNIDPNTGMTLPFSVLVFAAFRPQDVGETPAVEVFLEDASGNAVLLPGPAGPAGELQAVRVASAAQLQEPLIPGIYIPKGTINPRTQMVLGFANGLPLPVGQKYAWRVRVDHTTRPEWAEPFYVPGPNPSPVIG